MLEKLATAGIVDIVALADGDAFPLVGIKRVPWPTQKRQRAQQFVRWLKTRIKHPEPERAIPQGLTAAEQYRRSHPYDPLFRGRETPGPATPAYSPPEQSPLLQASKATDALLRDGDVLPPPSVSASEEQLGAVVERFRNRQWALAEATSKHLQNTTLPKVWHRLLSLGAERARKLLWTPQAAEMVEQHRPHLFSMGTATLRLPRAQLWFELQTPAQISPCGEVAAIFLFAMQDHPLWDHLSQQAPASARALFLLGRDIFHPERQLLTINVVQRNGNLVWAGGLGINAGHGQLDQPFWFVPPWHRCLPGQCQVVFSPSPGAQTSADSILCPACQEAQRHFTTWVATAWHLLGGTQREAEQQEHHQDTSGQVSTAEAPTSTLTRSRQETQRPKDDAHYRVVRHLDLTAAPAPRAPTEPQHPHGSWLEPLLEEDPTAVVYEQRAVPARTRTLRHPRYASYIARMGTNQLAVRPYTKAVPLRLRPKAYSKVKATRRPQKDASS